MFAAIAAIIFLLALLGVEIGNVNMTLLGLFFVALHLMWGFNPVAYLNRPNS